MANTGFAIDKARDSIDDTRDSFDAKDDDALYDSDDRALLDEDKEVGQSLNTPATSAKLKRFFGIDPAGPDRRTEAHDTGRKSRRRNMEKHSLQRRRRGRDESIELMHDMEDGATRTSTDSSYASSEIDREELLKASASHTVGPA